MEVVMGRCFPLTGPGHQHNADFPLVKGIVYKREKNPDSHAIKCVNGKDTSMARSPGGRPPPPGEQDLDQRKDLTQHQNVFSHNNSQPRSVVSEHRLPSTDREHGTQHKEEATADKKINSPKPKMQSILRRTYSASDPEGRDSSDNTMTGDEHGRQERGGDKEPSWGKKAWELTQRRKAQMRDEFFKVPYEECNKEAARSLGGRLNKSEPRLNTLGKERKKRNSLSYKRRVHFDLDYSEDEDNRKPRLRTKSFEAPDPPKKVVVSIYSIDKPKCVIQPDAFQCSSPPDEPLQAARLPANTRTRSARPTDLDSLQQKVNADVTEGRQHPNCKEQPNNKLTKQARQEQSQDIVPSETHQLPIGQAKGLATPTPEGSHCALPITPRHNPASPLQSAPNTPAAHCHPHLSCNTSSPFPTQPCPAPVPAPRARLTKSQSLTGDTRPSSKPQTHIPSQPSRPRPDHLKLNSPSSTRASVYVFTPTKTFTHPQESLATRTHIITPSTRPPTHVPVSPDTHTRATQNTSAPPSTPTPPTVHITPASRSPVSPSLTHTPATPKSPTYLHNGPVPMPRKRISVSQQTPTPQSSPHHNTQTPTPQILPTPTTQAHTTHQHTTPHAMESMTHGRKKDKPQEFPFNISRQNKENEATREKEKTNNLNRENSVNILMTRGDSFAKHSILISTQKSSAPPSVTVRKIFIPVTTPSRSSPSPTPSCASSSCSFGSSGSSSGCYSGSPSPTPTPSPTRIRGSCAPTDL